MQMKKACIFGKYMLLQRIAETLLLAVPHDHAAG
jgi:hypothetical protein